MKIRDIICAMVLFVFGPAIAAALSTVPTWLMFNFSRALEILLMPQLGLFPTDPISLSQTFAFGWLVTQTGILFAAGEAIVECYKESVKSDKHNH